MPSITGILMSSTTTSKAASNWTVSTALSPSAAVRTSKPRRPRIRATLRTNRSSSSTIRTRTLRLTDAPPFPDAGRDRRKAVKQARWGLGPGSKTV